TSSCHMGISKDPIFVPGVWGPYFSAMVPGFWLNEGGQSVTGKLIDHLVQGHPAFPELQAKATARCQSIYAYLNSHLDLIKKTEPVGFLTVDLHVWPDFHGNRSPLADLTLKGMVTGLKLSQDLDDLAILYLATVQAIAACLWSCRKRWSLFLWELLFWVPVPPGISLLCRRQWQE
uniref:FGGY carbohydrate kinase domain containing n=1 Tax=Ictidomys tridecemlineatus TaxID=43179 RepID=A0A287D881_ICTTR